MLKEVRVSALLTSPLRQQSSLTKSADPLAMVSLRSPVAQRFISGWTHITWDVPNPCHSGTSPPAIY